MFDHDGAPILALACAPGGAGTTACGGAGATVREERFAEPLPDADGLDEADLLDAELEAALDAASAVWAAQDALQEAVAVGSRVGVDGAPVTWADINALLAVQPADLDEEGRMAWLAALGRGCALVESRLDDGLVAVSGPAVRLVREPRGQAGQRLGAVMVDPDRDEVALALRCSPSYADARITTARRLAVLLPATRAALRDGLIDHVRARAIAEAADELLKGLPHGADPTGSHPDPELTPAAVDLCARLEARVLPTAGDRPLPALRRSCNRALHRLDPQAALRRAMAARRQRDVWLTPLPDGQAMVCARMDVVAAEGCLRAVEQAADQLKTQAARDGHPVDVDGDQARRRAGEWRVEAFAALLVHGRVEGIPERDVSMQLVIDLPTLLGLTDHPAEIAGHGPLSAQTARELVARAGRAWVRRLVVDPVTGQLLDYGRRTYRVPRRLQEYVAARDQRCRFPCCDHRADVTGIDIDHALAWREGGTTSAANLGVLHRRHHRSKTHHRWTIDPLEPDGSATITSPHGLRHRRPPTPVLEGSLPDPPPPF